ncbi:MAG: hypothetical protein M3R36_10865 [Bacteroidota bacterium]|nr:hypothetical protein [Bacteroidota bacterium]
MKENISKDDMKFFSKKNFYFFLPFIFLFAYRLLHLSNIIEEPAMWWKKSLCTTTKL